MRMSMRKRKRNRIRSRSRSRRKKRIKYQNKMNMRNMMSIIMTLRRIMSEKFDNSKIHKND